MAATGRTRHAFEWIGGALCLDFANTVSRATEGAAEERLSTWRDVAAWGCAAGLRAMATSPRSRSGKRWLRRVLDFRGVLHEVFDAVATGTQPSDRALERLERAIAAARAASRLRPARGAWRWEWQADLPGPNLVVGAVALSAEELLTSDGVTSVRRCANPGCGWLFVDRSRGRRRRWCDMKVCGNNAKARAFYQRSKGHPG